MVKIFVGNCSNDSTGDDLLRCFSKYGKVTQADVLEGKGYGFVHMESPNSAQSAVAALDGIELQGRKIRVELSSGKRESGGGPIRSSRGGGGFRSGDGGFRGESRSFGGDRGRGGSFRGRDRNGDRDGIGRGGSRGGRGGGYDRGDRHERGDRGPPRRDYASSDFNRSRGNDQYQSRYADPANAPFQQNRRSEPAPHYDQRAPPSRQAPSVGSYSRSGGSGEGVYYERRPLPVDAYSSRAYNPPGGFSQMQVPVQQSYTGSMGASGATGYTGVYEDSRALDRDRMQFRQM